MTKEELAKLISGREYCEELTPEEQKAAKQNGLVVIYGASDDLLEFAGAIHDEVCAYDGTTVHITPNGKIIETMEYRCDSHLRERCEFFTAWLEQQKTFTVDSTWCPPEPRCSWLITISGVPAATFDIMEDGELYCRGIVIDMKDLKSN